MIKIENFSFTYSDGRKALSDVSLSINDGERVALLGQNGAGKSTLLMQLNGILRGTGKIWIDGIELSDETLPKIRQIVGLIFQDPNDQLFCPTVGDDVSFGPLHFGLPREEIREIVQGALRKVGMEDSFSRPAHHLSIGERRRVTIASVLACDPKILALDEPAAMLDPERRRWLIEFLNASGKTVVLATHDLDFAHAICKRVVIMNHGQIVADGDMATIAENKELLSNNSLI